MIEISLTFSYNSHLKLRLRSQGTRAVGVYLFTEIEYLHHEIFFSSVEISSQRSNDAEFPETVLIDTAYPKLTCKSLWDHPLQLSGNNDGFKWTAAPFYDVSSMQLDRIIVPQTSSRNETSIILHNLLQNPNTDK